MAERNLHVYVAYYDVEGGVPRTVLFFRSSDEEALHYADVYRSQIRGENDDMFVVVAMYRVKLVQVCRLHGRFKDLRNAEEIFSANAAA